MAARTRVLWTIWIVLGVVALSSLLCCGGAGVFGFLRVQELAEHPEGFDGGLRDMAATMAGESYPAAMAFTETLAADHDVDAAWEKTTASFRKATPRRRFDDLHSAISDVMGDYQSMRIRSYRAKAGTDGTTRTLICDATFVNGPATVLIEMRSEGGTLRTETFRVDSPLFLKTLVAPNSDAGTGSRTEVVAGSEGDASR